MYYKPSILICLEGDMGKGSGRSVPGFDLYNALSKCNNYIEKFGGHSMAIGISIKKRKFWKTKSRNRKMCRRKQYKRYNANNKHRQKN